MADYDVTIIGAGPAGSVAGISLARRGHRVAIIEQHRFPRDKVCGECLSALGIDVLDRLALRQTLASSRPVCLTRAELVSPSGEIAAVELPRAMWGLSRLALDTKLLECARSAGVDVVQPARYEAGVVRDLVTNDTRAIRSHIFIRADGKAHEPTTTDLGVKAHFDGVRSPADAICLFGLSGHYIGLAPIEGSRWNLAMSIPVRRVREFHGDPEQVFGKILNENTELRARVTRARRVSDWLTCPLPRFAVSRTWAPHVIPIGNAAAALEPIAGEGMGLAMRSAELAADAIDMALRTNKDVDIIALHREYQRLWRWRSMIARATGWLMSRPTYSRILVKAAQSCESAVAPVLVPLGK